MFSTVAVGVRGVRWDEGFEHGQILAGQISYPAGHPLREYVGEAFSVQTYASGAIIALGGGPAIVCGTRNVLYLFATLLPAYLLVTLVSGKAAWGGMAGLLVLQGIFLEFDGSYPSAVWPELFSNGHIGGGFALVTLWALLAGHWRTTGMLFGMMPAIHVGQWPVLAGVFGLYGVWAWISRPEKRENIRGCFLFVLLGFGVCAAFLGYQRSLIESPPTGGPFASMGGDARPIWQGYTALHDPHRQFPPVNGHVMLTGTLVLGILASRRRAAGREHVAWLTIYAVGVAVAVWGTMAIHTVMGVNIPFGLIAWMPYRLINHLPVLFLAMALSLLCRNSQLWVLPVAAVAWGALHPLLEGLFPPMLYERYIQLGEGVVFGLFGAALTVLAGWGYRGVIGAVLAAGMLAWVHRYGAACVLAGSVAAIALKRFNTLETAGTRHNRALVFGTVLAAAVMLIPQWQGRHSLPVNYLDQRMAAELPENGMVLPPPGEFLLQARTGRAVLADVTMPSLISYMPNLGPGIERLFHDVYGQSFRLDGPTGDWRKIWRERSESEWRALAAEYKFNFVMAPMDVGVNLPIMMEDGEQAVHAVGEIHS